MIKVESRKSESRRDFLHLARTSVQELRKGVDMFPSAGSGNELTMHAA